MKKVPIKNYIILGLVLVISVLGVFYFRGWYLASKEYYASNSVIKDVAHEINANEISNYVLEDQKFILYVSSGMEPGVKSFENDFKKLIKKLDIMEDVLYLNLDNVDINSFNNDLKDSFIRNDRIASRVSNNSCATIYIFEDGKIVSVFNNAEGFSIKAISTYLNKWGFEND